MLFYLLACCATMIIVREFLPIFFFPKSFISRLTRYPNKKQDLNLSASATQRSLIASFLELRELAAEMEELKIDSSHLDESLVALDLLLTAWENDGESDFHELKVLLDYHTAINQHAVTINSRCDTMRQRLTAMK
ncbi:hypothetical protein MJO28_013076 [Puccinia striiformis f. sp. tritici]|uniref:Uncharacterized protein n=2 Tax=Puccinia striiformis TaxID=27350 RepID=A0A2S4V9D6_9BASI|nr:hypothetical protein MJO28_013076 [Puccinia striiformis f. sp. tritici]KAI7943154.1 hypothetical protein MJO29_012998 [Puccinia striiformis f. sp. tritici]POW06153.1 hypothetical protein PSTT_09239 [Puccinia striiformis]